MRDLWQWLATRAGWLELLVATAISIAPPNAALRKILSERSPIVVSMTEKPQILGLYYV